MELAFTSKFPGGFFAGQSLTIEASPNDENSWFCVSLATTSNILENKHQEPTWAIPFQIQLRYDQKLIVLNSHDGTSWTSEDRHELNVDRDDKLKLKLKAKDDEIEVYVNDNHVASFTHRQSLSSISHFNVYGDFVVKKVKLGAVPPHILSSVTLV